MPRWKKFFITPATCTCTVSSIQMVLPMASWGDRRLSGPRAFSLRTTYLIGLLQLYQPFRGTLPQKRPRSRSKESSRRRTGSSVTCLACCSYTFSVLECLAKPGFAQILPVKLYPRCWLMTPVIVSYVFLWPLVWRFVSPLLLTGC